MVNLVNFLRAFSFGPFLVLAFFTGAFVLWKKGKEEYYEENQLFDVMIAASFWGLVGARIGFIVVHFQDFGLDVLKWLSLVSFPGYLGFSGLLVGLFVLHAKAKQLKWDAYEVSDFGAIALALTTVVIALGMFVNGSGFGNPTNLPIGLSFPGVFDKRHPVQLYAALIYLIFFFILWRLERVYRTFLWYRENRRTAQTGFVFAAFCIGYGFIGLGLSFVSPAAFVLFGFPVDLIIYALSVFYGMGVMYVRSGRSLGFGGSKKKNAIASETPPVVG
jgi:phosphatidylglycerol:prolipoprotein diacylglycerol transferase